MKYYSITGGRVVIIILTSTFSMGQMEFTETDFLGQVASPFIKHLFPVKYGSIFPWSDTVLQIMKMDDPACLTTILMSNGNTYTHTWFCMYLYIRVYGGVYEVQQERKDIILLND